MKIIILNYYISAVEVFNLKDDALDAYETTEQYLTELGYDTNEIAYMIVDSNKVPVHFEDTNKILTYL